MKYIIELPKEVKEKFDNATKDDIYGSYYDYNSVIGNAIKNGTPFEEELRKLWLQIYNIDEPDHDFEGFYHCQNEVLELINKMKGE